MRNNKLPTNKRIKLIIIVLLSVSVMFAVMALFSANRTVGYVDGNKLYYKSEIYIEVDSCPSAGFGISLGKVDVGESKCDLLPMKGQPQYLHVSFGWDGRYYRKAE